MLQSQTERFSFLVMDFLTDVVMRLIVFCYLKCETCRRLRQISMFLKIQDCSKYV